MSHNLAMITARGGSKRIPRKNIKEFCGKPILAYSIEAARSSGAFDEVMVSTDDPEIAGIAVKYGASVPFFRSEATANDYASTDDVIMEVLKTYEERGEHFDNFCASSIMQNHNRQTLRAHIKYRSNTVLRYLFAIR